MSGAANRVYLAGPEVFLPDAHEVFARKKAICAAEGLVGVSPFDNEVAGMDGGAATARAIFRGNAEAMQGCAFAIANVTPFRGVSLDAGTAFEVGYMCALGRPVFAYSAEPADFASRTRAAAAGNPLVAQHTAEMAVEDFGLAENLMIPFGIIESGGRLFVAEAAGGDPFRALDLFEACAKAVGARVRGG